MLCISWGRSFLFCIHLICCGKNRGHRFAVEVPCLVLITTEQELHKPPERTAGIFLVHRSEEPGGIGIYVSRIAKGAWLIDLETISTQARPFRTEPEDINKYVREAIESSEVYETRTCCMTLP